MKTKRKDDGVARYHVEVITESKAVVVQEDAPGHGDGAGATMLTGRPKEVTVARNGSPVFSVRIDKDGNLSLVNCTGMFEHLFGAVVNLKNTRPWSDA